LIVLAFFALIFCGIGPFILWPRLGDILKGFNLSLPAPIRFLASESDYLPYWALLIAALSILPLARYVTILFSASSVNPPMGGQVLDRLKWWTPGFHSYERDRGMVELCEIARQAVESGLPMPEALSEAAEAQPNVILRNRVRRWADGLRRGLSIPDAARRARMPQLLSGMIAAARNDRAMVQAFSFLARHYRWRLDRTRQILIAAYIPVVCVLMGLLVGFMEYGVMEPITEMWHRLSAGWGGP